ncbi:citrate synthase, partial [Rhodospirillum rubrum]|nr:citrate synthase [Rhodospirillum rubrum]
MTATKGLEGIVATTSAISSIVDGVLTYRGYDIDDLAEHASFEEVAYLLWFGKLPNAEELKALQQDLSDYAAIPDELIEQIRLYPKDGNTMAALRSAVSALALYDAEGDDMSREANEKKAVKLQAQLPTIIAAIARVRQGKDPVAPKAGVSISENFLYMLRGEDPDQTSI